MLYQYNTLFIICQGNFHINDQNTRYKDGKKLSAEDAKSVPNFNEMLHSGMDAVEASRAYVEWCESKGYKPKFDRFVYNADGTFNENYYKLVRGNAIKVLNLPENF